MSLRKICCCFAFILNVLYLPGFTKKRFGCTGWAENHGVTKGACPALRADLESLIRAGHHMKIPEGKFIYFAFTSTYCNPWYFLKSSEHSSHKPVYVHKSNRDWIEMHSETSCSHSGKFWTCWSVKTSSASNIIKKHKFNTRVNQWGQSRLWKKEKNCQIWKKRSCGCQDVQFSPKIVLLSEGCWVLDTALRTHRSITH